MTGDNRNKPLLIILGATAIGKTELAIHIARALNGEIIGADSRQIYRQMDIGTAKPTRDQLQQAVHHMVDIVDPDELLTLAEYQERAYAIIDDITARGKLPLLVGGTGQYITAVEEGWSIPRVPPDYDLRDKLEAEAKAIGNEAFHQKLAEVDPEAARNIHPNNVRRVIRALEVYMATCTPISVLQRKQPPPYRIRTMGLTLERQLLYERADTRVDQMMAKGFLDEVQTLLDAGYSRELPSMSALGYRELASHLLDDISLDAAIQQTKHSTHNFIRRQDVWFRGHDNGILWHNINDLDRDQLMTTLTQWIQE